MNTIAFLETLPGRICATARGCSAATRRSPSCAILTLALGTGANAAIFQLVDAVRLRTLPVDRPARARRGPHRQGAERHGPGRFMGRWPHADVSALLQIREQQQVLHRRHGLGPDDASISRRAASSVRRRHCGSAATSSTRSASAPPRGRLIGAVRRRARAARPASC